VSQRCGVTQRALSSSAFEGRARDRGGMGPTSSSKRRNRRHRILDRIRHNTKYRSWHALDLDLSSTLHPGSDTSDLTEREPACFSDSEVCGRSYDLVSGFLLGGLPRLADAVQRPKDAHQGSDIPCSSQVIIGVVATCPTTSGSSSTLHYALVSKDENSERDRLDAADADYFPNLFCGTASDACDNTQQREGNQAHAYWHEGDSSKSRRSNIHERDASVRAFLPSTPQNALKGDTQSKDDEDEVINQFLLSCKASGDAESPETSTTSKT